MNSVYLMLLSMVLFQVVSAFTLSPAAWFRMNSILTLFFIIMALFGCSKLDIPPRHITDAMNCKVNPEDCR